MSKGGHTERAHALLSPSGSSRWINCTPSARLEDEVNEDKTSDFAGEGTLAHEIAELELLTYLDRIEPSEANEKAHALQESKYYYDGMLDEVEIYTSKVIEEYNESLSRTTDAVISIEGKVDFSEYVEQGYGSNDCIIIGDGVLKVIDLKFGKGVRVSAVNNSQLMLYGLGAYLKYSLMFDIHTVKLIISQPRLDAISEYELSVNDLIVWAETVLRPAAEKAYKGEGEQVTGDWCKFCKVKVHCKALHEEAMQVAKVDFSDPNKVSDEQVLELFRQSEKITSLLKNVNSYILAEALKGREWEGLKVVEGCSQRKYADENAVAEKLKELNYTEADIYNFKIKGIGDMEKLIGKKEFPNVLGELVIKPQGAPTLADESDKRPVFNSADFDFKDDLEEDI